MRPQPGDDRGHLIRKSGLSIEGCLDRNGNIPPAEAEEHHCGMLEKNQRNSNRRASCKPGWLILLAVQHSGRRAAGPIPEERQGLSRPQSAARRNLGKER